MSAPPDMMDPETMFEEGVKAVFTADLAANLGPFIMGFGVDFILFGVMLNQVANWASYVAGSERRFIKLVVIWTVLWSTANTCYLVSWNWDLFVYGFGIYHNFILVDTVMWILIFDMCITTAVQIFYIDRAWRLFRNQIWVIALVAPSLIASLAGGIMSAVYVPRLHDLTESASAKKYFYIWIGSTLITDLLLTGLILYGFSKTKTGWSNTDALLNRMMKLSVESQLPPTLSAIAFMINFGITPDSSMISFWQVTHPKIYVVSLLAVLNYRIALRNEESSSGNRHISSWKKSNAFGLASARQQDTIMLDKINIDTVTYEESHNIQASRIGINRQKSHDEESADGTFRPEDNSSTIRLNTMPSSSSLNRTGR